MDTTQPDPPRLIDRLRAVSQQWVAANEASLARLGRAVLNDSSYFTRAESQQGPTTATLEKFARYFADPASWPDGDVPDEAQAFAHVVGISLDQGSSSRCKADEDAPGRAAA